MTIKEIAALSGVSRGTVDRVLNGRGRVSPEAEKRVLETASRLGYVANRAGRALASFRNPPVFGVILSAKGNPFFDEVLQGVQAAETEYADFGLKIKSRWLPGYDPEAQLLELSQFLEQGISGLAVAPIDDERIGAKLKEFALAGIPVLTLNSDIEKAERFAYVGCDYYQSGRMAGGIVRLLHSNDGKIGVVTGSIQMKGHNQRVAGFASVCKEAGLQVIDVAESLDDDQVADRAVTGMLMAYPEINTLYFAAGGTAGGIKAVERFSRTDLLTVACDATPAIRQLLLEGRIASTVCQQPYEQGYRAIRLLFDRAVNGRIPQTEFCYVDNTIQIRESILPERF